MAYPNIAFNTRQPPLWKQEDDFSNLSHDALNERLLEARHAVDAMERELRLRGLLPHILLEKNYNLIMSKSKEIQQCGLEDNLKDNATEAAHELNRALTTDYKKLKLDPHKVAAWKFLCIVTRNCGCEVALICFSALGRHKLERMSKPKRLELLELLKKNKSDLVPSVVITFVTEYEFPSHTTRLHDLIKPEPVR
ncbi:hypothetical protein N7448_011302 [Penicillium atrosanguineum]|nr:hypothetical protein N7448_011302 [Penicillium atrosanguineum]